MASAGVTPKKGMNRYVKLGLGLLGIGLIIGTTVFLIIYFNKKSYTSKSTMGRHPHNSMLADPEYWKGTYPDKTPSGSPLDEAKAKAKAALYSCCGSDNLQMPTPTTGKTFHPNRTPITLRYQGKCCCDPVESWYQNPQNTMAPSTTKYVSAAYHCGTAGNTDKDGNCIDNQKNPIKNPKPNPTFVNSNMGFDPTCPNPTGPCKTVAPKYISSKKASLLNGMGKSFAGDKASYVYLYNIPAKPYPQPSTCKQLTDVVPNKSIKWKNPSRSGYPYLPTYMEETGATPPPVDNSVGAYWNKNLKPKYMGGNCQTWPWQSANDKKGACIKPKNN
jgi:hypothetical protein